MPGAYIPSAARLIKMSSISGSGLSVPCLAHPAGLWLMKVSSPGCRQLVAVSNRMPFLKA